MATYIMQCWFLYGGGNEKDYSIEYVEAATDEAAHAKAKSLRRNILKTYILEKMETSELKELLFVSTAPRQSVLDKLGFTYNGFVYELYVADKPIIEISHHDAWNFSHKQWKQFIDQAIEAKQAAEEQQLIHTRTAQLMTIGFDELNVYSNGGINIIVSDDDLLAAPEEWNAFFEETKNKVTPINQSL